MKIPVINKDNYTVYLELHAEVIWVHCDVLLFSPSIKKDMNEQWKSLMSLINNDLYVLRDPIIQKPSIPFIASYGFKHFKDIKDKQGQPKEIWKRDKSWAV